MAKKDKKINLYKISVNKLSDIIEKWFKENSKNNKMVSKTHLNNYLDLNSNGKRTLKNMGNLASTKKIDVIEKAYNRIKEYLIDSLLQTAEGRKIVFQTQYSMDEQQVESNGVVINLVQQKDSRDK